MSIEEIIEYLSSEIRKYEALEEEEFMNEGLINNYLGQIQALKRIREVLQTGVIPLK